VLKSISRLPVHTFRKNGNITLTYERAYECTAIDQTQMKQKVAYIEEQGRAFLERLGYREENGIYRILYPNEEKVALFCHSAFERAWLSTLLHIPLHLMWSCFQVTHTGVTVLEFKNYADGFTSPCCLCFSDMSHLYAQGLDLKHSNRAEL
jgi:probable phosphoglycerate mutase